ncbi:hypothetical protein FJZ26_01350 [Candidatus Parvarchaeota archaeon]|nr:hypothetical protein [Candidatus Parvarchaeota archaeon]
MRPRPFLLFALIVLATSSGLFAFDAKDYLYNGEDESSISTSSFSVGADSYSLVSYGGSETFLLKNGEFVKNRAEVESAIRANFIKSYFPSPAEIDELRVLGKKFNESRNAKTPYGERGAEGLCAQFTGQLNRECNDPVSCQVSCSALPDLCGRGFGDSTQVNYNGKTEFLGNVFANILTDFALGRVALDKQASIYFREVNSLNESNIITKLDSMASAISAMDATAKKMKTTLLRAGWGDYQVVARQSQCIAGKHCDVCETCISICPYVPYDFASLGTALQKINGYKARAVPLAKLPTISDQIITKTEERIKYKADTATSGDYSIRFEAIKKRYRNVSQEASEVRSVVKNSNFSAALSSWEAKTQAIEKKIKDFEFGGLDLLIKGYESDAQKVAALLNSTKRPYMQATDAQHSTNALLIRAEWRLDRSNKAAVDTFKALKATQTKYDSNFNPPYTKAEYATITGNYEQLESKAQKLIDSFSFSGNTIYVFVGNIVRVTVNGVLGLTSGIWPVNYKTRQIYAAYIPPIVLLVADFSFISLAILVFVAVIVKYKHVFSQRTVFLGWSAVLLILIGILLAATVGMFLIMNQAATSTSFDDFFYEVTSSNRAIILRDYANSTQAGQGAIDSCASKISKQLYSELRKNTTSYSLNGNQCIRPGSTTPISSDACFEQFIDLPVFHLKQSAKNQTPIFSVVYKKEALISGDVRYLEDCQVAQVLVK